MLRKVTLRMLARSTPLEVLWTKVSPSGDRQAPEVWVGGVFDSCWVVSKVARMR